MKKFFYVLVCLFLLFGCIKTQENKANKIPIRVTFWGSTEESDIIRETVKTWQKDHPEINVILEHIPAAGDISTYTSKVLTEMAGNTAPDIMFCEVDMFINFYLKNAFLDLNPLIKNDNSFNINNFYPQVVKRFTRDGQVYIIPRDTAPSGVVYYNKSLFDEQGIAYPKDNWTWNDLVRIGQKLTKFDKNGVTVQYGFYTWAWQNFVYSAGGRYVDSVENPTRCVINSQATRHGLQFYYDLMYKYKIHPQIQNLGVSWHQLFETGKLAMLGSGIWETPRFRKIKMFDWDVVSFPRTPEGKLTIATGGSGYGIYAKTKYPKEAWEVLKCLAGDMGQIMLAKTGLAQPANMKIANGEYWAKSKELPLNKGIVNKLVKNTIYAPFHPRWMEGFFTYVSPQVDLYLLKDQNLDATLKNIERDMNKLLKEKK